MSASRRWAPKDAVMWSSKCMYAGFTRNGHGTPRSLIPLTCLEVRAWKCRRLPSVRQKYAKIYDARFPTKCPLHARVTLQHPPSLVSWNSIISCTLFPFLLPSHHPLFSSSFTLTYGGTDFPRVVHLLFLPSLQQTSGAPRQWRSRVPSNTSREQARGTHHQRSRHRSCFRCSWCTRWQSKWSGNGSDFKILWYHAEKIYLIRTVEKDHLEGLAHFCEHLLFMGTEKYPKENDYYSYLSEHSGEEQFTHALPASAKLTPAYVWRLRQCFHGNWKYKLLLWSGPSMARRCSGSIRAFLYRPAVFCQLYRARAEGRRFR